MTSRAILNGWPLAAGVPVKFAATPNVITLGALSLSSTSATVGSAYSATISGKAAGSTILATSSDGTSLSVSGSTLSGTFAAAGSPTITLVETLAGATNNPNTSSGVLTVSAAAAVLPQQAAIVSRFRSDTGTSLAGTPSSVDGTKIDTWVDMVDGSKSVVQATSANQPTFKTNRFNGKPSVLFGGSQWLAGVVSAANTALSGGECSMLVVYANAQATSFGFLASLTNSTGFNISNSATAVGGGAGSASLLDEAVTGFATGMASVTQNYCGLSAGRGLVHVNGQYVSNFVTANFTPTSLGIGASATGVGPGKYEILEVIIWNRRLTAYEALQAEMAIRDYYGRPYPWASAAYLYQALGDSLSFGYGASSQPQKNWVRKFAAAKALPIGTWANYGYTGASPSTISSIVTNERLADITTLTGKPVKFSYFEFYNQRGLATATAVTNTKAVLNALKAVSGNKVAFGTTTDYAARGSEKAAWTTYWDNSANRAGSVDGYVPIHNDTLIGVDGACADVPPYGAGFDTGINAGTITGATITSGSNSLTGTGTTGTAPAVGTYVQGTQFPADTYITAISGTGTVTYTLSANATAAISAGTVQTQKGDGIHMGDTGHARMATLWDALVAM